MLGKYTGGRLRAPFIWSLACVLIGLIGSAAQAEDFYQDKQIKLAVASDPGGGYGAYARVLARHWSNHIPGKPQIIIQNMPGAGGLKAANFIAHVAPKDGLTVGALQNSIGYEPMMGIFRRQGERTVRRAEVELGRLDGERGGGNGFL